MHNNKVIDNVLKIVILELSAHALLKLAIIMVAWITFLNIALFTCKELKHQRKEQLTEDDELYASSYPIR